LLEETSDRRFSAFVSKIRLLSTGVGIAVKRGIMSKEELPYVTRNLPGFTKSLANLDGIPKQDGQVWGGLKPES